MKPADCEKACGELEPIHGWFSPNAARLFAWVDEIQKELGVVGDLFEIGCHHGRSTVLLSHMALDRGDGLGVCDIFGDQEANRSGSGSGDLEEFRRNLASAVDAGLQLEIHARSSSELRAEELGGAQRFFHVDGGHSMEEALSDIQLAAESLAPGGVIAVDDPFRPEWPGVTEAVIRFLDASPDFAPVVVGYNKLLLSRASDAESYRSRLDSQDDAERYGIGYPWHRKELEFTGRPLLIYYLPSYLDESAARGSRGLRGLLSRISGRIGF